MVDFWTDLIEPSWKDPTIKRERLLQATWSTAQQKHQPVPARLCPDRAVLQAIQLRP
jgi:hypothetical protein